MNQPDSLDAHLQAAQREIKQLRSELRASERHLAHLLELIEIQQGRLDSQQGSLSVWIAS